MSITIYKSEHTYQNESPGPAYYTDDICLKRQMRIHTTNRNNINCKITFNTLRTYNEELSINKLQPAKKGILEINYSYCLLYESITQARLALIATNYVVAQQEKNIKPKLLTF